MKFFIVLALLGAALATSHHSIERNIQETSFRAGREYRYLFNGQLSAGLPIPSTPQGITRLQTQVTLQLTDGNTARMQLQKIRFAVSQEETNSMKMLPFEKFEEVDNMDREHQQLLSMPVEFDYEHGLIGELRFTHGDQAWSENIKRAININGQQSPEQKKWVKQIEQAPEHETLLEAARLDQYQAVCEFDFEHKPAQYFNRYWSLVQAYLRTQYPWTSRIESREESSRKNVVRALFNIEPRQRQTVNMTIETPMETTVLERFELPFQLPTAQIHYQPRNNRFEEKPFFEKMVRHASKQAKCAVKSTQIQTFDEVTYRNQFTPCYSVLAKDCGSEEKEPRFVVLMKKVNEKKEWKNMKVLLGKQEIEMYMSEQGLVCLVNGEELEYQKDTQMEKKQFNLIWLNKNTIKFDSDDVTVQFDGVNARIHLSALYRNQQCGLCGHYDNEKETEFFDAENKENTIPKFAKSFLYQDSKCDYETEIFEKEDNFRRVEREQEQDEQEINYEESRREQDEPTEQVVVFEREHEICFTQKPVLRCENGKSQETKKQKTNVYCLPSSNSWARRQMREIRREPFTQWPEHKLRNLREQPQMEERVMRVAVDQKCEKYDY
uniref:Vitellogenin n=1 Tax=Caenorhabditis japonica TaxID=281687 RepID=A0A8R1IK39_CAEJA